MVMSALVSLVVTVLPLPFWLGVFRPAFLVLTVMYWSVAAPRAGGLALGWLAGLALDVFKGTVLGQHALALSLVTYISVREHQKIRSKPVFQQALLVLVGLAIYEVVVFAIDGWSGHPAVSPYRWAHIASGAVVWPIWAAVLERLHGRR
jgi:rod shape-determining protein MreD